MNKKQIAGILISLLFIYIAFRDVNFEEFSIAIAKANYEWILPATGAMVLSFWLRGYRWKFILNPVQEVSVRSAFSATMIGYMANNILPFRIGDLVRLVVISKYSGIKKAAALGSVFIERMLDFVMALAIFGMALISFPTLPEWASATGYGALILFCVLLLFTFYGRNHPDLFVKINNFVTKRFSEKVRLRGEEIVRSFSDGLKAVHNMSQLFWLLLLSFLVWAVNVSWVWFALEIFDFNLPVSASLLVLIFILFAVSIPSAPGYIGTFHGFVIAALVFMGVDSNAARASAVVMHATNYIPVTIMGLYFMWQDNITLKSATKSSYTNGID